MAQQPQNPASSGSSALSADPEIQALLEGLRAGGGTASSLTAIGQVPTGYTEEPTAPKDKRNVVRYFKGDERLPAALNSRKVEDIQSKLYHAGLLEGDFIKGVWDPVTEAAYESLLSYANATGLDKDDALLAYQSGDPMEIDPKTGQPRSRKVGTKGVTTAKLSIRYSNPANIADAANQVARQRLGRAFTGDELARFVAAFHGEEQRAQSADFSAQQGGGASTEAPTVESMASRFADQADPDAAHANRLMDYADEINSMLSGTNFGQATPGMPTGAG